MQFAVLANPVRLHLPLKASAVVFAVPCPLEGHRRDVSAVTGGIVRMDLSLCTPRKFHVLLPFDQVWHRRAMFGILAVWIVAARLVRDLCDPECTIRISSLLLLYGFPTVLCVPVSIGYVRQPMI